MTNQQFYLAPGLPILVNLLTTGLIILFVKAKIDGLEKTIDAQLKHLEEK